MDGLKIKGIILAGVHRWDRSSFEGIMPRSLVPIGHWPLISYVMGWLHGAAVSDLTVCANSASRTVRQWFGDGSRLGMRLEYYEDQVPRGPAGCVRDAGHFSDADLFVVAEATTIPRLDLADLLRAHLGAKAAATVVLTREPQGKATDKTHLVPAGIYILHRRVIDHIRETGYQDIKEVLIPRLHECGERVNAYVVEEPNLRVTDIGSYLAVNERILLQLAGNRETLPDYARVGESQVHRTAQLAAGVHLVGPVLIGAGTRVGSGTTIVGPTAIGGRCEIGQDVVVCRSILWDRSVIGHGCRLDRCVISTRAHVAPGSRLSNAIPLAPLRPGRSFLGRLARQVTRRMPGFGSPRDKNTPDLPCSLPDLDCSKTESDRTAETVVR